MQGHCYLVVPADAAINAVLTADEAAKLAGEMAGNEPGTRFLVCAMVEERVVLAGPQLQHVAGSPEWVQTEPAPSNLAASAGPSPTESSQNGLPQRCEPSDHDWSGTDYNNRFRCEHCGEQVKRSELPDRNAAPSARNLPSRLLMEHAA